MDSVKKHIRIIREIEIHTKRLLSGTLFGDNRSAVKGSGFEFDQMKDYLPGDDVRFIDWKATARANKCLIKQCIEERSKKIILVIDVSASVNFSDDNESKYNLMAKIASVLALVGMYSKDQIGCILYSDQIEAFIPVSKGEFHVRRIMNFLFEHKPLHKKTNLESALKLLAKLNYRDAAVFIISDLIDESLSSDYLRLIACKYDVIAIRCLEKLEKELPPVGFLLVKDIETGKLVYLDARKGNRLGVNTFLRQRIQEQDSILKKSGIEALAIRKEYVVEDIVRFFRKRLSA